MSCDANIEVRAATTTCAFAQDVFYELYAETGGAAVDATIRAWSPAAGRSFWTDCSGGSTLRCTTSDGGEVRFAASALAAYSDGQARRFASAHKTYGSVPAVDAGVDQTTPDDYDDPSEAAVPDSGAPTTEDFGSGNGYVVTCVDGTLSDSGGVQGACSHHGGVGG